MIDAPKLLADLQPLLQRLEDDIRSRCDAEPAVDAPLRQKYELARTGSRTAQAYSPWRDEQITQAAVAWVLAAVFVRFAEDNDLVEIPRLAGPGDRLRRAEDEHTLYFQKHPSHSDREYLLGVFELVASLPAMAELFDRTHNPLWSLGPSGYAAGELLRFFQRRDPSTGVLVHDFTDAGFDDPAAADPTRFLGDLYQDLSESARKRFALLQTPVFVEEFILDRTLTPAIREFGFTAVRLIDPTCGSGHFLLGAFHRLFAHWVRHEPGANVRTLAQNALDQVVGVDLNPFAIAIARFRLLVAAMRVCSLRRLANAPGFTIHLAAGDSLLHGSRPGRDVQRPTGNLWDTDDALKHHYDVEDAEQLRSLLGRQYHAVVGNPPYITPKDPALNAAYRQRFGSCHMKYSLAVPFFERFVDLTLGSTRSDPEQPAGFFGMITANSFMKREFGKKLIEQFIPRWDLTHILDTSGAYIPGHGTPTVILFGRHRPPVAGTIRTALGIAGEPSTPADPSRGLVWTAIVTQLDQPGTASRYIGVGDTPRDRFHAHPWSIGGGGAAELKMTLDEAGETKLKSLIDSAGITSVTGEDDLYMLGTKRDAARLRIARYRELTEGDVVRDWAIGQTVSTLWTFDDAFAVLPLDQLGVASQLLWKWKYSINRRKRFGTPMVDRGLTWYEWQELYATKLRTPLSIVFGEVATHNHFVLDRGGKVFKQTAPVIKLPGEAGEDDHLALLGLLNSSTACFWMKQVAFNKGAGGGTRVTAGRSPMGDEAWESHYAFNATTLQKVPLPADRPLPLARRLDGLAQEYAANLPDAVCARGVPTADALAAAREQAERIRNQMIAEQEELDWACYRLYGLTPTDLTHPNPPPIERGQRAFEIVLARAVEAGEIETTWFTRHRSTPITQIPSHWPSDYRERVQRRIDLIESDRDIALIEKPEYKRRWNDEPWDTQQERAVRGWLLDRLEGWPLEENAEGPRSRVWDERHPRLMSIGQLADAMRRDGEFVQVATLYRGRDDFDLTTLVSELVESESVPFLPAYRYKPSGLRQRAVWEQVWDLQREEDRLEARRAATSDPAEQAELKRAITGLNIPVPPKYKSSDMASGTIWRLRGPLDVAKERFVSYPNCRREGDPSGVITWAGFDALQQMQAVVGFYVEAKDRWSWEPERLTPLLAGMMELLPWVLQWHPDLDEHTGRPIGETFGAFLDDEARALGLTREQIRNWTPPARTSTRGRKAKAGGG
jgi:hypothetical protein